MSRSIWSTLGISATNDAVEIKRAYARRLKQVHPEDDPEGFQALRAAYDQATRMARNGWAVPQPVPPGAEDDAWDDEVEIDGGWPEAADRRWTNADGPDRATRDWAPPPGERWARADVADQATAEAGLPEDIRAELARERDVAEAHQALCDQLTALVADPRGDRQDALSAMIRVFRSPGMDSLSTYARTEQWLAHVVGYGGPVVEDMVEPVIHFFGWESRRVGVDLRHAEPVLRRREAGVALRRLERAADPDYATWKALKRKPTRMNRILDRLTPGFPAKVQALLQRIQFDHPELNDRMDPETLALWRTRLARPGLGPIFLWVLMLAPPTVAAMLNGAGDFGPPTLLTFLAFWTVIGSTLLGLGLGHLHGVMRPRLAWRSSDPWGRPLWLRFGWAPAALLLPVLAATVPPGWWHALLLLAAPFGLWTWAQITSAHIGRPDAPRFDWTRYVSIVPIFFYLLVQADLLGPQSGLLTAGFVAATLILQAGADALADELAHRSPRDRRLVGGGQLALVLLAGVAVVAAASWGVGLVATCGLVLALALGDRALSWSRTDQLMVARRFVLLMGWIGGFVVAAMMPLGSFAHQTFVGLSLWLLAAAGVTAVSNLLDGLDILRPRKGKRAPGEIA